MTKFLFDLDGTITKQETLPLIAARFGVGQGIDRLTRETVAGNLPFAESFVRRVRILGKLPVDEVAGLLTEVDVYPEIEEFIRKNRDDCCIVTGNLSCWIEGLVQRIGCAYHASEAVVEDNRVARISSVLCKEDIVRKMRDDGHRVVFIGDGNNDVEAMRIADVAIASALTHRPAEGVLAVADYLARDAAELCGRLNRLL